MGFPDLEKLQEKRNYMVNIQILSTFIHNAVAIYRKREIHTFFFFVISINVHYTFLNYIIKEQTIL